MSELDWNDIRVFLALFRARSVRKASEKLGMSHSTVSRHLTELENSLDAVLFTRSRDGLLPTDVAKQIVTKAEKVEGEVIGLERAVVGSDSAMSGQVRITCPPLLSQLMLMPMLAEFAASYPHVELVVNSSYSFEDLMRGESDVALRSQFNPDDNLVGNRLPDFTNFAYASPDYLREHWFEGNQTSATWLGRVKSGPSHSWINEAPFPEAASLHKFSDMMDQAQAAVAGLGMVVLPCYYADRLPGLVRIPGTGPLSKRSMWVLTHPDLRSSVRIKTFLRFLFAEISKQEKQITGE
ncbi:MAG: LysR family transcriptional regulator [Kofleriaceae bacterium]|nr:LysR family transcriptional regulator [Kofleriaceae bacterium]